MIIALSHNAPELIEPLKKQIPSVKFVDVANNPPIESFIRIENEMWVRNWQKVIDTLDCEYLWMLNDDIEGAFEAMFTDLVHIAKKNDAFMVTPSFNSPHSIFHSKGNGIREVNWIDMCCPLVNLDKFRQLGGFDLDFVGYFADIDLCYRATKKGFKMYVADYLKIHHLGGYTTNKVGSDQSNMAYNDVLIRKYGKSWNELI